MLTGRPLFQGSNAKSILKKNQNCQYKFNERSWLAISEEGRDLIEKMIDEDVNTRITA